MEVEEAILYFVGKRSKKLYVMRFYFWCNFMIVGRNPISYDKWIGVGKKVIESFLSSIFLSLSLWKDKIEKATHARHVLVRTTPKKIEGTKFTFSHACIYAVSICCTLYAIYIYMYQFALFISSSFPLPIFPMKTFTQKVNATKQSKHKYT